MKTATPGRAVTPAAPAGADNLPPRPAAPWSWTGFYVGGHAGAMSGLMNATFSVCNFIFAPLIGRMVDVTGNYNAVLVMIAAFPILGFACWVWISRLAQRQAGTGA